VREIARTLRRGTLLVGFTFTATHSRFSRFGKRHGARFFDVKELGDLLSQAGFEDYRPRVFGSALLFSAHRKGGDA
jgi:hypothetical protein